ncbi:MAG: bifunctional diaminohydroxyphosphoribosylaminopyrimidine deaminase/5-amino-6-(5-phosphoribosylamino)uracil reductase RibD [Prevotella sp.]|uniref:bifunctional diaminohydroxyphosphoribosylaminopyrimidine deaminase/5-amino-6-(5-phosphoribosylamino)uracil reductase RibD n=1 Tax=Prevotella sp. TaxID=59823 RepID=UPI00258A8953|nr:bifunctional diaminohydroxyphosphoribosylaminopyrimidine deaminase/5-amino-6-(5-phosphoribosylamino)uracil reductase RibD [Prevotella sp.]MDD6854284.1 bifunctional diaminohydroxyphosphoribosylaminopyrimidine deaminase/5-amino-6-(5-phosphoribosylamino)uracil reductase RibD [Prevotella sp.]
MVTKETDERFMRRCIQIARNGLLKAKPNPSVGAVIVDAGGRIIGEGYTSAFGGPHAEVNAFASVRPEDETLLPGATIYVSLEPCSHWGKTPPCCDLIIRKGVHRVVCGCVDPYAKVQGRGIKRIREAGIEVTVGILEKECIESNKRFFVFNTHRRPYILLKWAQSADGFIDDHCRPARFSTPFTQMLTHKLRAENDAILVGRTTVERDNPQLTVREWTGRDPLRIVLTHDKTVAEAFGRSLGEGWKVFGDIDETLDWLYNNGRQSLIVEGGAATINSFIARGLWDEIRVETAPKIVGDGTKAPKIPDGAVEKCRDVFDGNSIAYYKRLINLSFRKNG